MKVSAFVSIDFDLEIDDRFKSLDPAFNENLAINEALHKECLREISREIRKCFCDISPIQYFNINAIENMETQNLIGEQ